MANLFVCPSVTRWYGIKTNARIVEFLQLPGRSATLIILGQTPLQNSNGKSFSGTLNTRGGKSLRFSTEIAVYLGGDAENAGVEISAW